jgi:hypothetical protein
MLVTYLIELLTCAGRDAAAREKKWAGYVCAKWWERGKLRKRTMMRMMG